MGSSSSLLLIARGLRARGRRPNSQTEPDDACSPRASGTLGCKCLRQCGEGGELAPDFHFTDGPPRSLVGRAEKDAGPA